MFGQAWMDEDTAHIPEPDFGVLNDGSDDLASVKSVVDGFLAQTHYSQEDVAGYINTALQNESGTLMNKAVMARDLSDHWSSYADARGPEEMDGSQLTAEEALAKSAEVLSTFHADFDVRRQLLAETVLELQSEGKIGLTVDTWSSMANLDADGQFSESLGFDAQATLSELRERVAAVARTVATVPTFTRVAPVDFSQDMGEEEPLAAAAAQIEAEDQKAREGQMDATVDAGVEKENMQASNHRRKFSPGRKAGAPVKAGAVMASPGFTESWTESSRRKLASAMEDYAQEQAAGADNQLG